MTDIDREHQRATVKLLRALAAGSTHQANKHDVIFTAAADEIERLQAMVDDWVPRSAQARKAMRGQLGRRPINSCA